MRLTSILTVLLLAAVGCFSDEPTPCTCNGAFSRDFSVENLLFSIGDDGQFLFSWENSYSGTVCGGGAGGTVDDSDTYLERISVRAPDLTVEMRETTRRSLTLNEPIAHSADLADFFPDLTPGSYDVRVALVPEAGDECDPDGIDEDNNEADIPLPI